jgi:hypothetical protein
VKTITGRYSKHLGVPELCQQGPKGLGLEGLGLQEHLLDASQGGQQSTAYPSRAHGLQKRVRREKHLNMHNMRVIDGSNRKSEPTSGCTGYTRPNGIPMML